MLTALFQFFRAPTYESVGPIFAFDTSYDAVLRKVVPFGGQKIEIYNLTELLSLKSRNFTMVPMRN